MGQYFMPVNYDKKQFLHPHKFGDGLKATEFIGGRGTMSALGFLLASPLDQSGDFSMPDDMQMPYDSEQLAGSWAGDRIEILGDYHDTNIRKPDDATYAMIRDQENDWEDISELMWNIVEANSWGEWKPPLEDRRYWEEKEQKKPDTTPHIETDEEYAKRVAAIDSPDTPDIKTIRETNSENWRT